MEVKKQSEFDQRKDIIDLQRKFDLEKHDRTMEELKYRRDSELIFHDHEMERQRIKSAEIRKMQERKAQARDFRDYSRN